MHRIGVLGGGLMGHGIAQVFACAGHAVRITDPAAEVRATIASRIAANLGDAAVASDVLPRVEIVDSVEACVADADWVIEAAPEDLELKRRLFATIERAAPATAILASNTSVIPIGQIMTLVAGKDRALGTHWWNPPYLVPLVEVVRTAETLDAAVAATMALLRSVGKSPVEVKKDVAGFIGNRLQHALWREAIALVAEGVCDARTVDEVVKSSFGARLAVLGPLENADLIGIELTRAVHRHVLPTLDRTTEPSAYLDTLIANGRLGFKTSAGFYEWTVAEQEALRARVVRHLAAHFGSRAAEPEPAR